MLRDWCQNVFRAATGRPPAPPSAQNSFAPYDPSGGAPASGAHGGVGTGHVHIENAGYTYSSHAPIHAARAAPSTIPLWVKKVGVISAVCGAPPLVLASFSGSAPPAGNIPVTPVNQTSSGPTQVPEPGGIWLMPLGVVVIIAAAKRGKARQAAEPSSSILR